MDELIRKLVLTIVFRNGSCYWMIEILERKLII